MEARPTRRVADYASDRSNYDGDPTGPLDQAEWNADWDERDSEVLDSLVELTDLTEVDWQGLRLSMIERTGVDRSAADIYAHYCRKRYYNKRGRASSLRPANLACEQQGLGLAMPSWSKGGSLPPAADAGPSPPQTTVAASRGHSESVAPAPGYGRLNPTADSAPQQTVVAASMACSGPPAPGYGHAARHLGPLYGAASPANLAKRKLGPLCDAAEDGDSDAPTMTGYTTMTTMAAQAYTAAAQQPDLTPEQAQANAMELATAQAQVYMVVQGIATAQHEARVSAQPLANPQPDDNGAFPASSQHGHRQGFPSAASAAAAAASAQPPRARAQVGGYPLSPRGMHSSQQPVQGVHPPQQQQQLWAWLSRQQQLFHPFTASPQQQQQQQTAAELHRRATEPAGMSQVLRSCASRGCGTVAFFIFFVCAC